MFPISQAHMPMKIIKASIKGILLELEIFQNIFG